MSHDEHLNEPNDEPTDGWWLEPRYTEDVIDDIIFQRDTQQEHYHHIIMALLREYEALGEDAYELVDELELYKLGWKGKRYNYADWKRGDYISHPPSPSQA